MCTRSSPSLNSRTFPPCRADREETSTRSARRYRLCIFVCMKLLRPLFGNMRRSANWTKHLAATCACRYSSGRSMLAISCNVVIGAYFLSELKQFMMATEKRKYASPRKPRCRNAHAMLTKCHDVFDLNLLSRSVGCRVL